MQIKEVRRMIEEKMSEEDIQIEVVRFLNAHNIYFEIGLEGIFLPNPHRKGTPAYNKQFAVNKGVLKKMKATGMKKGPSDLKIYFKHKVIHMELKKLKGGSQSKEQKQVEKEMSKFSYADYVLCKGLTNALNIIKKEMNESV